MVMRRWRSVAVGLVVALALAGAWRLYAGWRTEEPYTATVVDAATGRPMPGVIVLALWWDDVVGKKVWWEGSTTVIDRFWEGKTGAGGVVTIPGFWRRRLFGKGPSLLAYTPGYVIWNNRVIFPGYADRQDFTRADRTIKLEKWKQGYSYPDHDSFMERITEGCMRDKNYQGGKKLFFDKFRDYELPFTLREMNRERK